MDSATMRRVSSHKLTYRNDRVSYTCMTASKNKGSSFFLQIYIMFKKFTEQNIYFFIFARFLKVGSKIRFLIRRLDGVTSNNSSTSIKSNACSRLKIFGGTRVNASSAEEERVLVRCFFLHTFNSMSSFLEQEPITIPAYTF